MPHEQREPARDATALVLAGGQSRRFGTEDKARHAVAGRPMIRRAYEAVRSVTAGPVLVSVRAGQRRFGALPNDERVRYVEDAAPDAGPLAGLVAGLHASETDWLLALACDLPFAGPAALGRLLDARAAGEGVVAEAPDGHRQPLCACYRREAAFPAAEENLRVGRLSLHALLDQLAVHAVPLESSVLRNVNRPADLREASR